MSGSTKRRECGVVDFRFEALSENLPWQTGNQVTDFLMRLRISAGLSVNAGDGTSFAAAGFTWDHNLFKKLFVEASFGGAVHNGVTDNNNNPSKRNLGANPLFWQAVSIGFELVGNWRLLATVEHLDKYGLGTSNAGLTNFGLRAGYRF